MEENFRVQEFVAHSTQVNCAAIGPKSNQVFATGGEDMKVNVWRVGSVSNIWTLGHNKSAVESLCFDSDEVNVISGAFNGSLKVYDLNEGKLARSLGSHQVGVTSIQYHPYGEFLVSGSADCVMKFWDVRAKSCVESYTGHKKEITCVRFSPDGKWVASSSKDGQLIFYDLIASKHINTIKLPQNYITNFEFNPTDFSLAAITTARNVKLWDLESMKPIFSTTPESSNLVKAIAFSNLGTQLYTTAKSNLKCWDLENTGTSAAAANGKLIKSVEVGWESIVDMKISNNDSMVAVSFLSNFVSVWELELSHFFPPNGDDCEAPEDSYPPEETKSTSNNTNNANNGRGRSEPVDVAPSKAPASTTATSKATSNGDKSTSASVGSSRSNSGLESGMDGLYIAGSKFRSGGSGAAGAKEGVVSSGGPVPVPIVSTNPITGATTYYTKEVKLSHIRNTNPNTNNNNPLYHYAADQKDADEKPLPLSSRPLAPASSSATTSARANSGLRTPTSALPPTGSGSASSRGEISEHKAAVYLTPTLQQHQQPTEDEDEEVIDEELGPGEEEYRARAQVRRPSAGPNNSRSNSNSNSHRRAAVVEEEEDEIEDEIEDLVERSRGSEQKDFSEDFSEEEEEVEPEVVPEEGMASVAQDMATSMGESFWKRFHASQQQQQQAQQQQGNTPAQQPVKRTAMVLGGDYHDEEEEGIGGIALPPTNFTKAGGAGAAGGGGGGPRSATSSTKTTASTGSATAVGPASRPSSLSSESAARLVRTPSNSNNSSNSSNNSNVPIQVLAPPVRTPSSSSSSSSSSSAVAPPGSANNEIQTCLTTLDSLLAATAPFQATLSSRMVTLKTLRSTYVHQSFPLFLEHVQVLLTTIQAYPGSPSSQPVFTALCDFLLTISFSKVNISLDNVMKLLPWLIQLIAYHYDTINLTSTTSSLTPRSSSSSSSSSTAADLAGSVAFVVKSVFRQCLLLLQGFGELVRNTKAFGLPGVHQVVDVNREERYSKCMVCYQAFVDGLTYSEKYLHLLRSASAPVTPRYQMMNMNNAASSVYQEEEELLKEFQQLMKQYFS